MENRTRIELPTDDDMARLDKLLKAVGGRHVVWGAQQLLDLWVAETRLEAERQTARRVLLATWVLALATVGLVAATVGLIVVTLRG